MGQEARTRIQAQISWRIEPGDEPGRLVAVCDELDLVTGGDSIAEVRSMIEDIMGLLAEDIAEEDNLEEYLRHMGVKYTKTREAKTSGFDIIPYIWAVPEQEGSGVFQQVSA